MSYIFLMKEYCNLSWKYVYLAWAEIWNVSFSRNFCVECFIHLFLHNLNVLNSNSYDNILFFHHQIRDAPLDIWGGGGARVFVACKLFFTSERKQFFFWQSTSDNFFFNVSSNNFFVGCFPYYVGYRLVFFLVNIFFINFDNKLFFPPTFSTNVFFLTFVVTN